ncbi:murein hydrolase activator EnvC family protein [Azonexus sp.]|uniref:murein hydrolase activator EnvC family protein n=1 Tax=Azonexus sp. TaxID=1872668 RepID=UPI0039E45E91
MSFSFQRRSIAHSMLAFALYFLCASPLWAQKTASAPEVAEKRADLSELRQRIDGLRKELSSNEDSRADAADRLRESERQISRLQRQLHDLGSQRGQLQTQLGALENQSRSLAATLTQQQTQLEQLLYRQYLRGDPDSLQLLLNGDDPNQMARDLHYLSAIANARSDLMGEIRQTIQQKKTLAAQTRERSSELAEVENEQRKQHSELDKERQAHKTLYAEISDKVRSQRREIGALQRDEKRMTQLIDRLSRILAQQAAAARAAEAQRRKQMEEAARKAAAAGKTPPPAASEKKSAGETENHYEPAPSDGSFAKLKGRLRLPVQGAVSGRFGSAREGGGQWRGVFIRAANGQPVKAIAKGRVVFAEWMRGFGNLLIIDHGDNYLSIYGNNDALLKQVGQAVQGGDTIASVGNTGGNPESGLYFEIRRQGQPIDPLSWATLK